MKNTGFTSARKKDSKKKDRGTIDLYVDISITRRRRASSYGIAGKHPTFSESSTKGRMVINPHCSFPSIFVKI
jgi:hypothetical protein